MGKKRRKCAHIQFFGACFRGKRFFIKCRVFDLALNGDKMC